jgi:hypothetical protein
MTTFLLISISVFFIFNTWAQSANSWLDNGSYWHYSTFYFAGNQPVGYNHYFYAQDTLIANRIFQQVKVEQQLRTIDFNGNFVIGDTVSFPSKYFFTSNDTVYILGSNNNLQFAWYNNPTVGDVWDFGIQYDSMQNQFTNAYSQVDSIKFVTINGEVLKEIYSHACNDSLGTPLQPLEYVFEVNHINCINTKFGPKIGFNGINKYQNTSVSDSYIQDYILCFESSTFDFYQFSKTDCNNGILTEINEIETTKNIYLYPNPANDRICFSNSILFNTLNIYNNIGQLQQTFINSNNSSIDISQLSKGFYTYTMTDNKQNIIGNGKFIKE